MLFYLLFVCMPHVHMLLLYQHGRKGILEITHIYSKYKGKIKAPAAWNLLKHSCVFSGVYKLKEYPVLYPFKIRKELGLKVRPLSVFRIYPQYLIDDILYPPAVTKVRIKLFHIDRRSDPVVILLYRYPLMHDRVVFHRLIY